MGEVIEYLTDHNIVIDDYSKEIKPGVESAIKTVVRGIMYGRLKFADREDGEKYLIQTLSNGQNLEYKNQKAVAKQAMNKIKDDDVGLLRLNAFAMSLCNMPPDYNVPEKDSALTGAIGTLLFS